MNSTGFVVATGIFSRFRFLCGWSSLDHHSAWECENKKCGRMPTLVRRVVLQTAFFLVWIRTFGKRRLRSPCLMDARHPVGPLVRGPGTFASVQSSVMVKKRIGRCGPSKCWALVSSRAVTSRCEHRLSRRQGWQALVGACKFYWYTGKNCSLPCNNFTHPCSVRYRTLQRHSIMIDVNTWGFTARLFRRHLRYHDVYYIHIAVDRHHDGGDATASFLHVCISQCRGLVHLPS